MSKFLLNNDERTEGTYDGFEVGEELHEFLRELIDEFAECYFDVLD